MNSYGYFLPSLDLNLLVTPQLKVRADFSRTRCAAQRAAHPEHELRRTRNALTATGNNPGLLPYLSDNLT